MMWNLASSAAAPARGHGVFMTASSDPACRGTAHRIHEPHIGADLAFALTAAVLGGAGVVRHRGGQRRRPDPMWRNMACPRLDIRASRVECQGSTAAPGSWRSARTRSTVFFARHLWSVVIAWTVIAALVHWAHLAGSWHYFATGTRLLTSLSDPTGNLHLYHSHPQLQIGPLTFLAAWPILALPGGVAKVAAVAVMSAVGVLILKVISDLVPGDTVTARRHLLLPALLFVPVWEELAARAGHLDDALALLLGVLGLRAVLRNRPVVAGLLLAAAADCKPWALAFVPLLLLDGRTGRCRWRGGTLTAWAAALIVVWLPFLIADPRTLGATGFTITNSASSALRALGVDAAGTPSWCRPAQLAVALVLGVLLLARGRPRDVLLVAIAVRMLLDPGTYSYYTAGLLVGTVVADTSTPSRRVPWLTLGATAAVYLPAYLHSGPLGAAHLHGLLRAGYLLAAIGAVCLGPHSETPGPRPAGRAQSAILPVAQTEQQPQHAHHHHAQ